MASRKGRVRPPVDAQVGRVDSGGRALTDNTFLTAQEQYQEATRSARSVVRPRQFRASIGDIADYTRDSRQLVDRNELTLATETLQTLRVYGKNSTGGTLVRGEAVYISGASGTNILFSKAKADTETTSSKTLGLVESESTANNGFCWVVTEGFLFNTDTSAFTDGAALWLSPSTAGGVTTTKPTAPYHMVFIGYCTRANANVGEIYVKPQNGFELQELHNVSISSVTNGQVLQYDSTTSLWKNATPSGGSGSGNVTGPGSATDNAIARFDTASGTLIQNSATLIDDDGNVSIKSSVSNIQARIHFYEATLNGSYSIALRAPVNITGGDVIFTLPGADGTSGQVLKTDASGNLSFGDVAIGNVSGLATGVATFLATPSSANLATAVTDETGSGKLVFADTTGVAANKVLKWNGSNWVMGSVSDATEFSFLITSFSVSPSALQDIGTGVWKAATLLSFTAAYQNSSGMTAASIQISGTGVTAWGTALSLSSPYTSGTSAADTSYPSMTGASSYRSITFTLTATRGSETPTRTTTVQFANRRYWGTSTKASGYATGDVTGLANNELSTSRAKTSFTTSAASTYYVIYATPVLLSTATFTDNATGFAFSMTSPETVSVTNPNTSYVENYYVYRSTYSGLGSVDVKVS